MREHKRRFAVAPGCTCLTEVGQEIVVSWEPEDPTPTPQHLERCFSPVPHKTLTCNNLGAQSWPHVSVSVTCVHLVQLCECVCINIDIYVCICICMCMCMCMCIYMCIYIYVHVYVYHGILIFILTSIFVSIYTNA